MTTPTVVVVAQSGRYLAQIAHQAGYRVWVADCYGDVDTLTIADRWYHISELSNTDAILDALIALSQGEPCQLIYGSGVECFYPLLALLPKHINLVGNQLNTLTHFFQAGAFTTLLSELKLPHPETQLTPPLHLDDRWLQKSCSGFGGQDIVLASNHCPSDPHYFQRYHHGQAASVLFVANGEQGLILSTQQQYTRDCRSFDFTLLGLSHQHDLFEPYQAVLEDMVNKVVNYTGLVGLNSLDFILSEEGQLLVLEINPRISASIQLLPDTLPIFDIHLAACMEARLPSEAPRSQSRHLHTIFAPADLLIPSDIHWPPYCADLPASHTSIKKNEPICSAIVESSDDFARSQQQIEAALFKLLF